MPDLILLGTEGVTVVFVVKVIFHCHVRFLITRADQLCRIKLLFFYCRVQSGWKCQISNFLLINEVNDLKLEDIVIKQYEVDE